MAGLKAEGPTASPPDTTAVNNGICYLQTFPESYSVSTHYVGEHEYPYDFSCIGQPNDPNLLTYDPVPVWSRCVASFIWWNNPYTHYDCHRNSSQVSMTAEFI